MSKLSKLFARSPGTSSDDKTQGESQCKENLRLLLEQHWLWARHLEHERTLFLLAVMGMMAVSLLIFNATGNKPMILIPLALTLLGFILTYNWNGLIKAHLEKADIILGELGGVNISRKLNAEEDLDVHVNIDAGGVLSVFRVNCLFYSFYLLVFVALIVLWVCS